MTAAIRLGDVVNFFEYEKVREDRRRRVIALKERRRVEVGPYLSFVFENRETLLFQIQEMCRAERIIDDAKIQEEIDKPVLDRFMGIDTGRHVWFEVGAGLTVPGSFEAGHSDEEKGKLAAVHFVRFAVSREAARSFRDSEVHLVVDHPTARARPTLRRGQGRAADRPDPLTGARGAANFAYCMIMNQM